MEPMKYKLPNSSRNWLSLVGATMALITLFMIIFLFSISFFLERGGSYLGIIIFLGLPAFLILSLLLIPIGMFIEIRKRNKRGGVGRVGWPLLDLNTPKHKNAVTIFLIGSTIFLFMSAIGSYEAFHFTESNEFCGTLCHSIMIPEYTAYQNSPHARVACVDCHIGSGADWYVKSKMSGLYQVYAATVGIYPKPIPTPISNLRPARETCEQCHWPQKFYNKTLRSERHFIADENNTEWDINLTMKIGADHSGLGLQEGIHWHINPDVKLEYIATDEKRQIIPWIKYTNLRTGDTTIYINEEEEIDLTQLDTLETRIMDCTDCHNRPSHNYKPPAFFVNVAMSAGKIPKELPEIKSLAMDICDTEFPTTDSAMTFIRNEITTFYEENYEDIFSSDQDLIEQAINGLQTEYSKYIFPEMKVRWDAYPNNIGHVEFNGCFRCHNDITASDEGKLISKDCNSCHIITSQGEPGNMQFAEAGKALEFKHPTDIEEEWKESLCVDCHTGLNP